jgi:hypothetical protein
LPFCRPRERRNHDAASLINENISKRWSVDGQRLFCVGKKIINDSMLRSTKTFESRRRQQQQEWNELTRERRPRPVSWAARMFIREVESCQREAVTG